MEEEYHQPEVIETHHQKFELNKGSFQGTTAIQVVEKPQVRYKLPDVKVTIPKHLQQNHAEGDLLVADESPSRIKIGQIETKQVQRKYDVEKDLICDEGTTVNTAKRPLPKKKIQTSTNVPKYKKEVKHIYKKPNFDEYHKQLQEEKVKQMVIESKTQIIEIEGNPQHQVYEKVNNRNMAINLKYDPQEQQKKYLMQEMELQKHVMQAEM